METTSPLAPSLTAADAEDAPTTGHTSARSPRVELITRGERRRVWTPEQKREIVMESLGPALTPTEVARKYAITSGLLYTWRGQVLGGQCYRNTHKYVSQRYVSEINFSHIDDECQRRRENASGTSTGCPLGLPVFWSIDWRILETR